MKKYLRIAFMSFFAIVIVSVTAFFLVNYYESENSQNKLPFVSQQPLTATTSAPTTAAPTTAQPVETEPMIDLDALSIIDLYPLSLAGGSWDVKHCQGIAIDKKNGYIYYSYTTILVKCKMDDGSIVGTVNVPGGHLGDITFNEKDGKIYCGYYTTGRKGFYIVIFNADKITKNDMKPTKDIVRTVFVKDAWDDYCATVTFTEETTQPTANEAGETTPTAKPKTYSYSHRYGTSGIDGVTFGPDFSGKIKNKELLTVAYGIYPDATRKDNDYQILLQYDVSSWWNTIAQPYSTTTFHRSCPESANGKYFLYTGNTFYGVQTMEYFDELNLWILCTYRKERKSDFLPFSIFAIDGDVAPVLQTVKNQPTKEKQLVLSLYHDGQYDSKNNLYGWNSSYGVQGIAYMGDGLFYIVRPYKSWTGTKTAICYLNAWSGETPDPFTLAAGIGNDYSISKKIR